MQPTSSQSVYNKKLIIGIPILLIVLGLIATTTYFLFFRPSDHTQAEAATATDTFVSLVQSGDSEASYSYLSSDLFTPNNWAIWVDSVNQPGVEIGGRTAIEPAEEDTDESSTSYQVTYSFSTGDSLALTVSWRDDSWKITKLRVIML